MLRMHAVRRHVKVAEYVHLNLMTIVRAYIGAGCFL